MNLQKFFSEREFKITLDKPRFGHHFACYSYAEDDLGSMTLSYTKYLNKKEEFRELIRLTTADTSEQFLFIDGEPAVAGENGVDLKELLRKVKLVFCTQASASR